MKFADHLTKKEIQRINSLRHSQRNEKEVKTNPPKPKLKKRNQEKFSTKEIEELMGTHMSTYKRVKGAIRRK